MFRMLNYPFNIAIAMFVSLLLCALNFSFFYKPISIDDVIYILIVIFSFCFIGIFINRRKIVITNKFAYCNLYIAFLIISAGGFSIEFLLYGIPAFSIGGRDSYAGIPVLHVIFYSSTMIAVLMSSLFSSKRELAVCLINAIIISALLLSRQMMMICITTILISIFTRYEINKKIMLRVVISIAVVIFMFGAVGNIRQQLSGDYVDDYIIKIGGANKDGEAMGQAFYWVWLYIASPMYNLLININSYYSYNESCNMAVYYGSCQGDYFSSVILPNTISKYTGFEEFVIDMQMHHLNAGTAFSSAARIMGLPGIILQIFMQMIFFIFGYIFTSRNIRQAYVLYFSTLSLFMIFDNLYIKGEFFFGFILIFLSPFINRISEFFANAVGIKRRKFNSYKHRVF